MAEWLYEAGIGEARAALVEHGTILEARLAPDRPGPALGAVLAARLVEITVKGREGRVSFAGGEALLCPTPSWLQPASATDSAGGGCWHTHFHATLTPRPHASGGDERCAGRHATEAAALAACLDDAACDGVTRDEKRELGAIEQACGARVHYSLRSLPLRPYRGVWSGATTWVKLRGAARAECQRGVARLAELAAQPVPVPSGWEPPPLGVGGASVAELELLEEEHRREERLARVAAQGVTSATGGEPEQGGDA